MKTEGGIKKFARKSLVVVMASFLAVVMTAGMSLAAEKLVVQDAAANNVFSVHDTGNTGFNIATPLYPADVSSSGGASKSQLHFSLNGSDTGGWLTSVLENNFWISSGAVFDNAAGGWIQKSSDGQSVFFGSGGVGFRAFLQEGNTPGQPLSNINVAMLMDYNGNLKARSGLQMNMGTGVAKPACDSTVQGMLWMTKGATDLLQVCASKAGTLSWYNISF